MEFLLLRNLALTRALGGGSNRILLKEDNSASTDDG